MRMDVCVSVRENVGMFRTNQVNRCLVMRFNVKWGSAGFKCASVGIRVCGMKQRLFNC